MLAILDYGDFAGSVMEIGRYRACGADTLTGSGVNHESIIRL